MKNKEKLQYCFDRNAVFYSILLVTIFLLSARVIHFIDIKNADITFAIYDGKLSHLVELLFCVCTFDTLQLILLSMTSSKKTGIMSAVLVFSLRGVTFGLATLSHMEFTHIISYVAASVLFIGYSVFIKTVKTEKSEKVLYYLLSNGTAVILRAIPFIV